MPRTGRPKGRPTKYSEAVANEICDRLADGESLLSICTDEHLPSERSVRTWAYNEDHPFSPKYARARELGYLRMADEILAIADDATLDLSSEDEDGNARVNHEHIARSKLRVDTRKWLLSKCLPKIYGDKIMSEHTGADGGPIEVQDTEMARRVAFMLGKAVGKASKTDETVE